MDAIKKNKNKIEKLAEKKSLKYYGRKTTFKVSKQYTGKVKMVRFSNTQKSIYIYIKQNLMKPYKKELRH